MREYFVRFYLKNPGGAYDPAHLAQFDIEGQPDEPISNPAIPVPGDMIFAWSKSSDEPEGQNHYYKVLERAYRFDPDEVFVFVLVEAVPSHWTEPFG